MLKENELIGAIAIYRQEVRPFTDKQIELVQNFAAQAVIAIENTRLLNELRQRTDDLTESLEQQTATSEVLKVISSSPGELEPVFEAMLENATRICEAKFGNLFRYDGDAFRTAALHNAPPALCRMSAAARTVPCRDRGSAARSRRCRRSRSSTLPTCGRCRIPTAIRRSPELGGARTLLAVPMLKEDELIGAIVIYRQEVRPFTDKQIELVTNFAAQAVIAIENTRLLNELRAIAAAADRHRRRAQGHQPLDLRPADGARNARRSRRPGCARPTRPPSLAQKGDAYLSRREPTASRRNSWSTCKDHPVEPGRGIGTGRALLEGKIIHIPTFRPIRTTPSIEAQRLGGFRTMLGVPMLREGSPNRRAGA